MKALFAAAALTFVMAASPAFAGDQDFNLNNATGYTIEKVYVAPSKSTDWEEDVLGDDVLADGSNVDITFPQAGNACKYDLKVVYDDGEEAVWGNLDLCTISSVKIRYNRASGATSATVQ